MKYMELFSMDINKAQAGLFEALGRNDFNQLQKIKNDASGNLSASSGMSEDQKVFALNTISLINEVLLNQKIESSQAGSQEKGVYQDLMQVSVKHHTSVNNTVDSNKELETLSAAADLVFGSQSVSQDKTFINDFVGNLKGVYASQDSFYGSISDIHPSLQMLRTTGDGNCFYNAVSTADAILVEEDPNADIKATEKEHKAKREATTEYMRTHSDAMGIGKSDYKQHQANGTWATDTQIRALVGAEGKPVLVIKMNPANPTQLVGTIYSKALDKGCQFLSPVESDQLRVIINQGNVHYNAIDSIPAARQALIQYFAAQVVPVP
jgi:hypothetical protein